MKSFCPIVILSARVDDRFHSPRWDRLSSALYKKMFLVALDKGSTFKVNLWLLITIIYCGASHTLFFIPNTKMPSLFEQCQSVPESHILPVNPCGGSGGVNVVTGTDQYVSDM